ncbi:MAG: hypothetical protein V4607_00680 [Pseudomonadota bacterium]
MNSSLTVPKKSLWAATGSLLFASSTLICCVLPAVMVALGAGAALAGLVSAVPQLVWLSAHKAWVFSAAGVALAAAGYMQWRARFEPCPADPALAEACARTRKLSTIVYWVAVTAYGVGVLFAFVLPRLLSA